MMYRVTIEMPYKPYNNDYECTETVHFTFTNEAAMYKFIELALKNSADPERTTVSITPETPVKAEDEDSEGDDDIELPL